MCNRSSSLQILLAERPCGLRVGRKQVLILPAGVYQKLEVTRPRKMGVQGGDAYEHPPLARCSSKELYGDNVIEKHGINRDRTGGREKTRYLCGKQGISPGTGH